MHSPGETGHSAREFVSEGGDSCFLPQEKLKPEYLEQLPGMMKLFSEFLGKRQWFVGNKVNRKESRFVFFPGYRILCSLILWPFADHLCGFSGL
jgi:hypothetical protein